VEPWGALDISARPSRALSQEAGGLAQYERGRWRHIFDAEADFAQDNGRRTRQRFEAGAETNYDISERAYALGFVDFEHNRFSGFDYRISEGAGLGYRIVDTDRLFLSVEAGPGARHSRIKSTGTLQTELVGRISGEFSWQITDSTEFTQSLAALIGQETTSLSSRSALSIAINDSWKARLGYRVDHETNPPAGAKSTDTRTDVSLVYEF
jgi:putative salt-induced outer membrane protein